MKNKALNWTRGFFRSTYKLYEDGNNIGYFKSSVWGSSALGLIYDQKFLFQPKGVFSGTIDIIDVTSKAKLGVIETKAFSSKKIIWLKNEAPVFLTAKGFFRKRWILETENEVVIEIKSKETKGKIELSKPNNNIVTLSGLYGMNQYYEYWAAFVVVITAVLASQYF